MQLRALYGGRHLRTTLVLAGTSAAAGAVTGIVGFSVAGTPAANTTPPPRKPATATHAHPSASATTHRTTTPLQPYLRGSRSHSPSVSPSATPTARHTPTAAATTPASSPSTARSTAPATSPATTPPSPSADPSSTPSQGGGG